MSGHNFKPKVFMARRVIVFIGRNAFPPPPHLSFIHSRIAQLSGLAKFRSQTHARTHIHAHTHSCVVALCVPKLGEAGGRVWGGAKYSSNVYSRCALIAHTGTLAASPSIPTRYGHYMCAHMHTHTQPERDTRAHQHTSANTHIRV